MKRVAAIAKALSDPSRVRIVFYLGQGELCACQLIDLVGSAPSTVSRHLSILTEVGLIRRRKEGRWHHYRLADGDAPPEISRALDWAASALAQSPDAPAELERVLAKVQESEKKTCQHKKK